VPAQAGQIDFGSLKLRTKICMQSSAVKMRNIGKRKLCEAILQSRPSGGLRLGKLGNADTEFVKITLSKAERGFVVGHFV
jgi:hypothetical protein